MRLQPRVKRMQFNIFSALSSSLLPSSLSFFFFYFLYTSGKYSVLQRHVFQFSAETSHSQRSKACGFLSCRFPIIIFISSFWPDKPVSRETFPITVSLYRFSTDSTTCFYFMPGSKPPSYNYQRVAIAEAAASVVVL